MAVVPGTAFDPEDSGVSHSFRLTYATPTEEQIVTGVKILGELVIDMLAEVK